MTAELRDSRDERHGDAQSFVNWSTDPVYLFADESDALTTLQELGEELQAAREQVKHITRYLKAACTAAYVQAEVTPQAIIRESGLARQTVYDVLPSSADTTDHDAR